MSDKALDLAHLSLTHALAAIRSGRYEEAEDNIGDVLNQIEGFCRRDLRLTGNVSSVVTKADLEPWPSWIQDGADDVKGAAV